ncbi:MAG: hypothetical protein A2W91_13190 [Bacteroidetes bacterium GWF2_38_335]|nr:MAG: hypothetical protein A2W91_13190 [Bacteroidetes bacterium GWF2_38_335]OFY77209.1 MAG: hypothetical protein A2281_14855 [Bacteroidetes bacterium RIFOXYA12_FULL_38_20]HBS85789.1 hypothetical protein [Bacteroidales bacterium]
MEESLGLLSSLIQLIKSDGQIKEKEYVFLTEMARMLNVSKEKLDELFNQEVPFIPPKHEFDRIIHFHRLVLMMNFDLDTNKNELDFINQLGLKMGLNTLAISKVLIEMNNYPNKVVPPERLIEIFRENYN